MEKQIKKLAKISAMIALAIVINLAISTYSQQTTTLAYTIPEDLIPINEPFRIGKDLSGQGATTASGTIIFLQILAGGLLYFAAPVAIIIIALAGFNMTIQGAESEKIEEAKRSLKWAVIGLLLIILSYSLVRIIIDSALKAAAL